MIEESRGLLTSGAAEMLAIDVFSWLAGQPDAIGRFLSLTGIEPAEVRSAAARSGFLAAVLDFVSRDEALLVAYASYADIPASRVAAAVRTLNGNDL